MSKLVFLSDVFMMELSSHCYCCWFLAQKMGEKKTCVLSNWKICCCVCVIVPFSVCFSIVFFLWTVRGLRKSRNDRKRALRLGFEATEYKFFHWKIIDWCCMMKSRFKVIQLNVSCGKKNIFELFKKTKTAISSS